MSRLAPSVLLLALGLAACDLPRDADGTLDRVRHGTMRVGVVAHAPWVVDSGGTVGGVEGALVADLARQLGARIEWVRRPESELLLALHRRELDLVIGGLTDALPWKQQVAFTRPYYTDTVVVGVLPGTTRPQEVKGATIAVEPGDPVAADVREQGAVPVPVTDLAAAPGAVAAPVWRLPGLRRASAGIVLHQERHVLAVPQGENAWLVAVERALRRRKGAVPAMLRAAHA